MAVYTMSKQEWLKFQSKLFEEMRALTRAKNADYTGGTDDPFANFRESEDFGVPTLTGLCVRMGDKFQRIKSFATKGKLEVAGEGVDDAFRDLIGYSCLALGLLEEASRQTNLTMEDVREVGTAMNSVQVPAGTPAFIPDEEAIKWANEDMKVVPQQEGVK